MSQPSTYADLLGADREWTRSIALGAPPFHRCRHPAFATTRTREGAEAAAAWRAAAVQQEPGADDAVLRVLSLDATELDKAFGDATLRLDQAPPEWVECLARTLARLPSHDTRHAAHTDSIEVATDSFQEAARDLLDWDELVLRHPFLGERALASVSQHLATRVVMTCGSVLELENLGAADLRWDFSRSAWRQRLIGFTGLNYVVGTGIRQWRQNVNELVLRLGSDLDAIRELLFSGSDPGPVEDIAFDLGDRHHDGRAVAAITFASGSSVIYKPKDLRCADTFVRLVDTLNAAAGGPLLPSFRLLPRAGYSWEEFIAQRATSTRQEASILFRRYGALLRVLQLVEGRDFWVDNLRIAADQPLFVDLECTFQPRIPGTGFQVRPSELDPRLYEESVLPTGAVTQPMDVPGFGRQDFGGLAGSGTRALPLGLWSGYRDRDNGNIMLRDGRLFWYPDVAWPIVEDRPAAAVSFLSDLEAGFREAQAVLERIPHVLLAEDGPLHDVAHLRVRALLRSTWEYLLLLRSSLTPSALLTGAAREISLASVLSTAPAWGDPGRLDDRMRLACSEVDALRQLDVPEFLSCPSTTIVADAAGVPLADLFTGTAERRLTDRLERLDQFDVDTHAQILRVGVVSIGALEGQS